MSVSTILSSQGGRYQLTISSAPQRPSGLSFFDVNQNGFTVSWAPTPGAISYVAEATPLSAGGEVLGVVTGTQAVFTGLDAGETYNVVIIAVSPGGETPSITLTITTNPPLFAPNVPVAGTGVNTTPTSFDFTFTPSVVDATHGFASLYTGIADDGGTLRTATAVSSPMTFTGLDAATTYAVTMRAENDAGNSAYTVGVNVPTSAASAPATPVITVIDTITTSGFTVRFTPGARSQSFTSVATAGGDTYPAFSISVNPEIPTEGTATYRNLTASTLFSVTVTGTNDVGSTTSAATTVITDITPPAAPVITKVETFNSGPSGTEAIIYFTGVPNFQQVGPPAAGYFARLYFNNATEYLQFNPPQEAFPNQGGPEFYRAFVGSASNANVPGVSPVKGVTYDAQVYGSNAGGQTFSLPFTFTYPA